MTRSLHVAAVVLVVTQSANTVIACVIVALHAHCSFPRLWHIVAMCGTAYTLLLSHYPECSQNVCVHNSLILLYHTIMLLHPY